jgi:hypothetical protein
MRNLAILTILVGTCALSMSAKKTTETTTEQKKKDSTLSRAQIHKRCVGKCRKQKKQVDLVNIEGYSDDEDWCLCK